MARPAGGAARAITCGAAVQVSGAWASYGGEPALRGVSMSVRRGSNYAIVGRSGSGKSTLLKLLNGSVAAERGAVLVDYTPADRRRGAFRAMLPRIGYIPQSLGLVRNTSALGNALVGALPRTGRLRSALGAYAASDVAEARRALAAVGLAGKEGRMAHELSGGERRRVAIARALVQRPDLLLADEIASELDPATAEGVMGLVAGAQRRLGLTAVMVHHDVGLALRYADRVAVIDGGSKVLEIGVDGDHIVDFQTGDLTTQDILEMYRD